MNHLWLLYYYAWLIYVCISVWYHIGFIAILALEADLYLMLGEKTIVDTISSDQSHWTAAGGWCSVVCLKKQRVYNEVECGPQSTTHKYYQININQTL